MRTSLSTGGLLLLLWACSTSEEASGRPTASCAVDQRALPIFRGAAQSFLGEPQATSDAIVKLENLATNLLCSGVLVRTTWVLTAKHCLRGATAQQLVVHRPHGDGVTLAALQLHPHDTQDIGLATFAEPVADAALEPIPADSTVGWTGDDAAAWGFGLDERGDSGTLLAARVAIVSREAGFIRTSGGGVSGTCLGDSGGPLMLRDADGRVKLLGVLSSGSSTCTGVDTFVELNADVLGWIDAIAGPAEAQRLTLGCGQIDSQGTCLNNVAIWCDDQGRVSGEACTRCGYHLERNRFACLRDSEVDPCSSTTALGACLPDGTSLQVCRAGQLSTRGCPDGTVCSDWVAGGVPGCVEDPDAEPPDAGAPDPATCPL